MEGKWGPPENLNIDVKIKEQRERERERQRQRQRQRFINIFSRETPGFIH